MKEKLKNPFVVINTLLIVFVGVMVLNANADRLHLPSPVQRALAAVASVTGSGNADRLAVFAAVNQIGDSIIQDNGTNVGIGMAPGSAKLSVNGAIMSGTISDSSGTHGFLGAYNSVANAAAFGIGTSVTDGAQWRLITVPSLGAGGFNPLSQAGDVGLIYKDGSASSEPANGLVIAPWTNIAVGMRMSKTSLAISVGGNSTGPSLVAGQIGIAAHNRIDLSAPTVAVNGEFWVPSPFKIHGTSADYAEWFEKEGSARPGDLIGVNKATGKARKYEKGDHFLGIYSASPIIAANAKGTDAEMIKTHVLVGLLGQLDFDRSQTVIEGRIVKTLDGAYVGILLSNDKVLIGR